MILGAHEPENVVLLEIDPDHQKTLPDFHIYEDKLGIATVDIASLHKHGTGFTTNEMDAKFPFTAFITAPSSTNSSAGRFNSPSIIATSLTSNGPAILTGTSASASSPYPTSTTPAFPKPFFSMTGLLVRNLDGLPQDRNDLLLKPLYSFAGKGVHFSPHECGSRCYSRL